MTELLALAFPNIDPVLIAIGPFAVRWYALAYIVGLVGGWLYARRLAASARLWGGAPPPRAAVDDLLVYVALGIILGGRLGYVLVYNPEEYLRDPAQAFAIWQGGMSFHGGLAGAALAVLVLARVHRVAALSLMDLVATVAPIGIFLGRIANFINGELWGRPAPDFPYAMVFPGAGPVPRHPSQLYEAFAEGLVLFLVLALAVRAFGFRRPGLISGVFAIGYALARSVCELFREPDAQLGFLFDGLTIFGSGITMGMVLNAPLLIAGVMLVVIALARRAPGTLATERA